MSRLLTLPRLLVTGVLAAGLVLAGAVPAGADAPVRTGWWNRASAQGQALPYPAASDGQLHVGNSVDGANAYAALRYELGEAGDSFQATLVLDVVPNSVVGTPQLLACPVKKDDWKAGGNQPWSAGPGYDCSGGSSSGLVSDDGKTVAWFVDADQQARPGVLSLAIVPAPDIQEPFSIDFVKPDAQSLRVTSQSSPGGSPSSFGGPPSAGPSGVSGPPATGGLATAEGTGDAAVPSKLSTESLEGGPAASSPPSTSEVQTPQIAPGPGHGPGSAADQAKTAGLIGPLDQRQFALVLLVIVAMTLLYAGLRQQRHPLGIIPGGSGGPGGPGGPGGRSKSRALGNVTVTAPIRGLGRFARPRPDPPRRL